MKYFKNYKKVLMTCLIVGFIVAVLTRVSFFVFTTDFSYYRMGLSAYPVPQEFDGTNLGKSVVGESGFPFSAYSDCVMGYHGTLVSPACNDFSTIGEFSVVFNTIFWAFIYYGIFVLISTIKKPTLPRKHE